MGYTHYWTRKQEYPNNSRWALAVRECSAVIQASGVPVRYEYDDADPAHVNRGGIRFNGVGDDGHETFVFPRVEKDIGHHPDTKPGEAWVFCKTARKPYDVVVAGCLIVLGLRLGVRVTSDGRGEEGGEWDGWTPARDLVRRACPNLNVDAFAFAGR